MKNFCLSGKAGWAGRRWCGCGRGLQENKTGIGSHAQIFTATRERNLNKRQLREIHHLAHIHWLSNLLPLPFLNYPCLGSSISFAFKFFSKALKSQLMSTQWITHHSRLICRSGRGFESRLQ